MYFNPRPPCGERQRRFQCLRSYSVYFNPRPPCGERPYFGYHNGGFQSISIHAPHAGSDLAPIMIVSQVFNFNPRPPCGERRARGAPLFLCKGISIHAPHAGSDIVPFLCTSLLIPISIHAPHAGSDLYNHSGQDHELDFNPRPPCGERPEPRLCLLSVILFQSTPPMRGATVSVQPACLGIKISIHAPHAGSDCVALGAVFVLVDFNPRPPCGERPLCVPIFDLLCNFNPRPPCGERPQSVNSLAVAFVNFNPRPPCGERPAVRPPYNGFLGDFNPRPPCGERHPLFNAHSLKFKFQSTPPMRGATRL